MVLFSVSYFPRVQCSVQPPQSSARGSSGVHLWGQRPASANHRPALCPRWPITAQEVTWHRLHSDDISSANESWVWPWAANQSAGMRCISRPERRSSELLPTPRPSFIDWSNVVQVDLSLITFIACVSVSVYYFSSFRSGKWWYKSFCRKFLLLLTSSIQTWCLDLRDFE